MNFIKMVSCGLVSLAVTAAIAWSLVDSTADLSGTVRDSGNLQLVATGTHSGDRPLRLGAAVLLQ